MPTAAVFALSRAAVPCYDDQALAEAEDAWRVRDAGYGGVWAVGALQVRRLHGHALQDLERQRQLGRDGDQGEGRLHRRRARARAHLDAASTGKGEGAAREYLGEAWP